MNFFSKDWSKIALITDQNVASLYGREIKKTLFHSASDIHVITIDPGEKSKSRSEKEKIENELVERGFDRNSLIVALGGGVVGDLAGFVAATFLRGVAFAYIPTTLLAMVDASIGGKCGINTPFGKNLIGAFYPPNHVSIDTKFLETLSLQDYQCGLMEMIKIALTHDKKLFYLLMQEAPIEVLIERARRLKQEVVDRDSGEKGERRALNFGHTVAHALERMSDYSIPHGEAVWVGLLVESQMSLQKGFLDVNDFEMIYDFLRSKQGNFELPSDLNGDVLFENMKSDKKNQQNRVRMVLIEDIGRVASFGGEYCTEVALNEVKEAVDSILARRVSEVYG